MKFLGSIKRKIYLTFITIKATLIYRKMKEYTMMPKKDFIDYIKFINDYRFLQGNIVECGVWRGGASAGAASIFKGDRKYYLFDSFEGLPVAREIDGEKAINWQNNKNSPDYYDNCCAEINYAEIAMKKSKQYHNTVFVKGWFSETVPLNKVENIAVLRLDGDWYDSTLICLEHLYDKVNPGGLVIIDDYYIWDGCSRALHDFLSKYKKAEKINKIYSSGCYIVKKNDK